MESAKGKVLPYRTSADDIVRFVDNVSHGRTIEQIQSIFSSGHTFAGTSVAAAALGFIDEEGGLTELGKEFTLEEGRRRELLLQSLLQFEPYELLLEVVLNGSQSESTSLGWIEKWWATSDYGNSANNRSEASSSFARIIDFVGLGDYKQGRRGFASRIEWQTDASERVSEARTPNKQGAAAQLEKDVPAQERKTPKTEEVRESAKQKQANPTGFSQVVNSNSNALQLQLSEGRVAQVTVPSSLTSKEKERLLKLIDLLVEARDPDRSQTASESQSSLFE